MQTDRQDLTRAKALDGCENEKHRACIASFSPEHRADAAPAVSGPTRCSPASEASGEQRLDCGQPATVLPTSGASRENAEREVRT